MTEDERSAAIEAVCTAHRPTDARGEVHFHPTWHDLDVGTRVEAATVAAAQRRLEALLDPDGLSTTARAVLRRISGGT